MLFRSDLGVLDCSSNQLSTLDFSKNTDLDSLDCRKNPLRSLIVSKNNPDWKYDEHVTVTELEP